MNNTKIQIETFKIGQIYKYVPKSNSPGIIIIGTYMLPTKNDFLYSGTRIGEKAVNKPPMLYSQEHFMILNKFEEDEKIYLQILAGSKKGWIQVTEIDTYIFISNY